MNTQPAFSPPNPEVEETVEVPAVGVHVVEEGEQYSVRSVQTTWHTCGCDDERHHLPRLSLPYFTEAGALGALLSLREYMSLHVVPVTTYTVVGEVRA